MSKGASSFAKAKRAGGSSSSTVRNSETWSYIFPVPLYYTCKLIVGMGDWKTLMEEYFPEYSCNGNDGLGCCIREGGTVAIFLGREQLTHTLISHETMHAAHRIASHCDFKLREGTTEPFAYLHGWISETVHDCLQKNHEKICPA